MTKTNKFLSLIGLFFLCLPAQAVTLKIATLAPDGTSWMQAMRKGADEIKERTEGRVKLRFYPGGVMGNDRTVLRKIRIGQLHGGAVSANGLASIAPDSQIYALPFLFRSYAEVDYVRNRMDFRILDRLKEKGFISFGLSEGGFAYLMSDDPIVRVQDLREKKVWTPEHDVISRTAFDSLGISPIPLPLADVLIGLQTGMIDTVAASPVGAIALQWHTSVAYLTDVPLLYLYGTLIVKEKALNSLSESDRAVLVEVMKSVFERLNQQDRMDNAAARSALENQGIEIVKPSQQQLDKLHKTVSTATRRLREEGYISPEILLIQQKHLAEFRARQGPWSALESRSDRPYMSK